MLSCETIVTNRTSVKPWPRSQDATSVSTVSTNGCTATGWPVIRNTTHLTEYVSGFDHAFGIERFEMSLKVFVYGGSLTTTIA
ncbi:hypothetical protein Tco_1108929 [Tanacetum coccineum]